MSVVWVMLKPRGDGVVPYIEVHGDKEEAYADALLVFGGELISDGHIDEDEFDSFMGSFDVIDEDVWMEFGQEFAAVSAGLSGPKHSPSMLMLALKGRRRHPQVIYVLKQRVL